VPDKKVERILYCLIDPRGNEASSRYNVAGCAGWT